MERDIELLVLRASTLVFGVFGHIERPDGGRELVVGGSGIFIAPFQALTARHVTRHLFSTDPSREDDLKRRVRAAEINARSDYFELPHSAILYQGQFGRIPRALEWHVHNVWDSQLTDISLMEVNAGSDEAGGRERGTAAYFEWSLLPPPVGSDVIMLGYPQATATSKGDLVNLGLRYVMQVGQVTDIYNQGRDRSMYSFPCVRINSQVDHGFSGGPVIWGDRLCGIVSGGDIEGGTIAASLWPLCLLEYKYPNLGELGGKRILGQMFDAGVLRSNDWAQIKDRITKEYDGNGLPIAYIK